MIVISHETKCVNVNKQFPWPRKIVSIPAGLRNVPHNMCIVHNEQVVYKPRSIAIVHNNFSLLDAPAQYMVQFHSTFIA